MAEEMVLRIVLEGIDNATDDIERTSGATNKLGKEMDNTTLKAAGLLLAVNGLASGLNQVSGGMRKFADAGERAGYVNEQNAERIRGLSDTLEFIAGPLEIISGVFNFLASVVIIAKLMPALGLATKALRVLGVVGAVASLPITGTVIALTALAASVLLLGVVIWTNKQKIADWEKKWIDLGGRIEWTKRQIDGAIDSARGFAEAVDDITFGGVRRRINDELAGLGGKISL